MSNTLLGLFSNPFTDLLGNPKFWLGVGVIVILCVLIFICIKYPKAGLPVLGGVIALGLVCLDVYCVLQINYYYNAKGGIYGVLTGLLETNKVEVVDNLTFEVKNIELTESSTGVYSASITTDQVLSLDTKQSLGIFINGLPCDTTSEVHSDFAYAEYPYTFHDNDKTAVCTDTLILNIAFYENSTYLNLSTKGGTLPVEECVKYWHHYFNKNSFIVKVAPFDNVSADLGYSKGDISNYAIVNYYVNDELYSSDCVVKGETIQLIELDDNKFLGWQTADGTLIYESMTLNESVDLYAKLADETTASYTVDFVNRGKKTSCVFYEGQEFEAPTVSGGSAVTFVGWSKSSSSKSMINVNTFVPTEDITLYAIYSRTVAVNKSITYTPEQIQLENTFDLDDYLSLDNFIDNTFQFSLSKTSVSGANFSLTHGMKGTYLTFTDSNLGEGSLKLTLDKTENVMTIKPLTTFVPASDAASYKLTMGTFVIYTL